jgi:putative methionine-R-sulfoxide reductase with GAF domain
VVIDRSKRIDARLDTLRSVSRALARPLDLVDILRSLYRETARVLDAPICFFGLYDAPGESVEVIWQTHDGVELPGGHFPLGRGPTSRAIRSHEPQLIRNWSREGPPVQVQYATDRPGLPESSITVPVMFDEEVVGVLAMQSYRPNAFDENDVILVQGIADQAAVAIARAQYGTGPSSDSSHGAAELEAILASMADAVLVLDDQGRLIRLNQAARMLLCPADGTVILGHPVDRPQEGRWPLGTQALTEQLLPIIDRLKQGDAPEEEVELAIAGSASRPVGCKASVLLKGGAPAGGLMVLREIGVSRAA